MKDKNDIEVINLDYDLDRDIINEFKVNDNLPAFMFFKDGKEVSELLWDKGNTVETVALLTYAANEKEH